ncbi:FAD-dependent oxidoreductase [bacterium]|nr:FAD-dependent oxidoreductase [bacterium]
MRYSTRLIGRRTIAVDAIEITVEKPRGYSFRAGQYAVLAIPDYNADSYVREFSIANAPHEKTLEFAMRLRDSSFKQALYSIPLGSELHLSNAEGVLRHVDEPVVWIAGGIGIVPMRSMLRDALQGQKALPVHLYVSNRTLESTPYENEFRAYAKDITSFKYLPVLTRTAQSGAMRRISLDYIGAETPDYHTRTYVIVGTRPFVASMREMLLRAGIADGKIMHERFCGYTTHDLNSIRIQNEYQRTSNECST